MSLPHRYNDMTWLRSARRRRKQRKEAGLEPAVRKNKFKVEDHLIVKSLSCLRRKELLARRCADFLSKAYEILGSIDISRESLAWFVVICGILENLGPN